MTKEKLSMYTKATTNKDVDDYYKESLVSINEIETKMKVKLSKLKGRLKLVYNMDLDNILKISLLDRIYGCELGQYDIKDIKEWIADGDSIDDLADTNNNELVCDLDACLEYYEYKTGRSWEENGNERQDVEPVVVDAFKKLKGYCKLTIMTEDYEVLFQP